MKINTNNLTIERDGKTIELTHREIREIHDTLENEYHILDISDCYECPEEDKQEIAEAIENAIENCDEYWDIYWILIRSVAKKFNLKEKDEEEN